MTGVDWNDLGGTNMRNKRLSFVLMSLALTLLLGATISLAETIDPNPPDELLQGNPTCTDLECLWEVEFKVDPPTSGTYPVAGFGSITVDFYDGDENLMYVDWSSDFGINAVIVKGSNYANVYHYDPAAFADTYLHAPVNPSGGYANISHLMFCGTPGTSVPEPSLVLLLGLGLGAVSLTSRFSKKS